MNHKVLAGFLFIFSLSLTAACQQIDAVKGVVPALASSTPAEKLAEKPLAPGVPKEIKAMLAGAVEQTSITKTYDPAYVVLSYPNGDVPAERGVCTDVVIRAMRKAGLDLQKEVHEDMAANFSVYPKKWGLSAADSNIDHRRVPNLQTFFSRRGKSIPITTNADDYKPGDFVTWDLDGKGLSHIGIVSNIWSEKNKRYLIIHNIGGGAEAEDRIFDWKITGHYRYF